MTLGAYIRDEYRRRADPRVYLTRAKYDVRLAQLVSRHEEERQRCWVDAVVHLLRACAVAALLTTAPGCMVAGDTASRVLADEGYEDVSLGGPDPFGCSQSETVSRSFTATRNGRRIEGVVCCTGVIFGGCVARVL